jgi:aryl-phospho-beta-D-glucosidase BglC (GH1 family)
MTTSTLLALGAIAVASFASLVAAQSAVTNERFARLARGINLSHWYAQSTTGQYDEARLSTYFTETDAQLVREMGFSHVRLTLDDTVVFDASSPGALHTNNLATLKSRIGWFLERDVAVIVDLHPGDEFKRSLLEPNGAEAFVSQWKALASALAELDPDKLFLEILNEPHHLKDDAWFSLQGRVLQAIRQAAPNHTVIVTGDEWGSLANLEKLAPYPDPNVVYTFHCYDPFIYTHQAATWGWDVTRAVGGLDWPVEAARADEVAKASTTTDEAQGHVRHAVATRTLEASWLKGHFDRISAWQAKHGMPRVYVGEFGVYRRAAPEDGRYRWHQAVVDEFEQRGWGWSMWDYAGGFAVVNTNDGRRVPDERMLKALGLRE